VTTPERSGSPRARFPGASGRTLPALVRSRIRHGVAAVALLLAMVVTAALLLHSQAEGRAQLNALFQTRADIAQRFVAVYVRDTFARERAVAQSALAAATVRPSTFETVMTALGFQAGVLLDRHGRALAVLPAAPRLLGTNLATRYAHLTAAVAGQPTVSHVVFSAARHIPVVAFALPYATNAGRRVISGAFNIGQTPVADYVRNALPQKGALVYVVDDPSGLLVVADQGVAQTQVSLLSADPALSRATAAGAQGSYHHGGDGYYFVARRVTGAPWRLVLAVPEQTLYAPLGGVTLWLPWAVFAALALGAVAFLRLVLQLADNRAALARANVDLDQLTRVDRLTGLYNRRHLEEQIAWLLRATRRHDATLATLLVDIDHFKSINDTHGHAAGDRALQAIAGQMRAGLRPEDVLGRWGGEEFLILVPRTDAAGASALAERLRHSIQDGLLDLGAGPPARITVSIGVAGSTRDDDAATLVARADAALYQAKRQGRNAVVVAGVVPRVAHDQGSAAPVPGTSQVGGTPMPEG